MKGPRYAPCVPHNTGTTIVQRNKGTEVIIHELLPSIIPTITFLRSTSTSSTKASESIQTHIRHPRRYPPARCMTKCLCPLVSTWPCTYAQNANASRESEYLPPVTPYLAARAEIPTHVHP